MKTIKDITVKVTYTVGFSDVEVPDKVYNDLIKQFDENAFGEVPEDSIAFEWISDNIRENDAMEWEYEIEDLE